MKQCWETDSRCWNLNIVSFNYTHIKMGDLLIFTFRPTSWFMMVLFPTFGTPIMAIFRSRDSSSCLLEDSNFNDISELQCLSLLSVSEGTSATPVKNLTSTLFHKFVPLQDLTEQGHSIFSLTLNTSVTQLKILWVILYSELWITLRSIRNTA